MKWTVEEAIRAARALQPFDLTWLEEPIIPDDIAGHARIMAAGGGRSRRRKPALALGVQELYRGRRVSYPEPDVTNCGGVTAFMKIARLAEAFNLPVTSHGAHDITVHLLAACPNRSYLEAHGFGLDRYIEQPLVPSNKAWLWRRRASALASPLTGAGWRRSRHSPERPARENPETECGSRSLHAWFFKVPCSSLMPSASARCISSVSTP